MSITPSPRRMPSMVNIVRYWSGREDQDRDQLYIDFPKLASKYIGWGEPFCFSCGWLVPVRDDGPWLDRWRNASSWLERAHLQDRFDGGSDSVSNIVPMCWLCHKVMPICETYERGVQYLNEQESVLAQNLKLREYWQSFTDAMCLDCVSPEDEYKPMRGSRAIVEDLLDRLMVVEKRAIEDYGVDGMFSYYDFIRAVGDYSRKYGYVPMKEHTEL